MILRNVESCFYTGLKDTRQVTDEHHVRHPERFSKSKHHGTLLTKANTIALMRRRFFSLLAAAMQSHPKVFPLYLGGKAIQPNTELSVLNKYTGEEFCKVALADEAIVEQATEIAATTGREAMGQLPAYKRQLVLQNVVNQAKKRRDEFAYYLAIEAGKPIKDSRGEADRLIQTFQLAAEEATRIYGEYANLEIAERAEGYTSVTKRVPIGPVSLISPFNFPLNLAAHKVAPAIAAGCPFVLKPASKTPLGALLIGEILAADTNMPGSGFSCDFTVQSKGGRQADDR